ncbi:MAG TPA: MerR family transcriptional regulator [Dokdonella sp.]|uniref:MerR family transcriptional regulator n=1 Tax=Dokdonella sp. TaxID=2291710 RepID=UPI002D7EDF30|nr:MerR family transcriptional regulator [Dokdonella sp.]HET9033310.1 MerR family transcriptional regulator [Dokdonella sp.]
MSETTQPTLHSVRVVARRTGLTPDLLRAWEKRYQVVQPARSAGGQRNYSDADIERLQLLVKVTAAGRSIGQVAGLGNAELRELAAGDQAADGTVYASEAQDAAVDHYLEVALGAAENFDATLLESTLRAAALQLPSDQALDGVFGPLLLEIGARWEQGRFPPANEHLATTIIRRVLTWMTDFPVTPEHSRTIVIATPATQLHDLGAMLAATVAATSGWRVAFLGASLPADELARATRLAHADTIALSIVYSSDPAHVSNQLRQLRSELPRSVAMVIGGAGAAAHADVLEQIGAHRLDSLAALRAWLAARWHVGEPRDPATG